MGFLLLLGLIPAFFLPDMLEPDSGAETGNGTGEGAGDDRADGGVVPIDEVLFPDTDDDDPFPASPVEGPVLSPDEDDDVPPDPPILPTDPVLTPVEDTDPFDPDSGSLLQQLLTTQTSGSAGIDDVGALVPVVDEIELTQTDDSLALPDDGIDGTGDGTVAHRQGTPVIESDAAVRVVSGGDGADTVTGGDDPTYLFGGAGDDVLTAGEGAAVLAGGTGNDLLQGSDAVRAGGGVVAWLDGGTGDDTLIGGDGSEVLEGGEHGGPDQQGDDLIRGGAGDDVLRGGLGADTLFGGDGNDALDHLGRAEERAGGEAGQFAWHLDGEADVLNGGPGNDTLTFDQADSATGGDGADVFWLYADPAGATTPAEITDFARGEDFLRISLNPDYPGADWAEIEVGASPDGLDGLVMVNGTPVAVLRGAPGISLSDIFVDVPQNVTA